MMDRRYQVKQYVARVVNERGMPFLVFITGDDKFYLFSQCFPETDQATGLQFPVEKKRLRDDVRRGLANGWGCDLTPPPLAEGWEAL